MKSKSVLQILEKVRDILSRPGTGLEGSSWIKNKFLKRVQGKNCYCLEGALMRATCNDEFSTKFYQVRTLLTETLPKVKAPYRANIIEWNDHPRRTYPQVIRLLGRAIARAKKAQAE